jgi:hypothetical protein
MWKPQHLTTLWVSTAHYRDTFTFTLPSYTSPFSEDQVPFEGEHDVLWEFVSDAGKAL